MNELEEAQACWLGIGSVGWVFELIRQTLMRGFFKQDGWMGGSLVFACCRKFFWYNIVILCLMVNLCTDPLGYSILLNDVFSLFVV